ncbi:MAG: ABC transporter ATP-binding protein [Meiothermus sp.]|nr:ABC transporter ATP-binding protein [Meiothermus sp.]
MLAKLENVTRRYGAKDGVSDLNLSLEAGQAVGLLGLNGSGKTTTLKLLAGLLYPSQGKVEVVGKLPRDARGQVAFLSDSDNLYNWLTPADAERLMRSLYPDFRPERYKELLGFLEVPIKPYGAMSKGQKARLRLAMVLAREAKLYLLDEPLGGIDLISRDRIMQTLVREWREDGVIVISTHEVAEAEGIFDRAVFLKEGRLVLDAMAEDLRQQGKSVKDAFLQVLI